MSDHGDEKDGTFLVTHADEDSAIVRDVVKSQVHTLSENPDLAEGDVVEATVAPEPPTNVTWTVVELASQRAIALESSDLEPTRQAVEAAEEQPIGELTKLERAGEGEVHVLSVPDTETAVEDVLDDDATLERAARLGATRVEVRTGEEMISVRYLPD